MENDPRSPERIRHHYEVEKELAARLLRSTREERTHLFRTLYDELFTRVPDHPRLVRRQTPEETQRGITARMALLRGQLDGVKTFLEFAPGDCRLAFEVCRHVEKAIGVDISDQTGQLTDRPANFELVVYDGYKLNVPDESVDLVFSYQMLEHLHPDDVELHFQLVRRILKPGGAYIFSTPHRFSGPSDISGSFSETPQGFHFKEWTYGEMDRALEKAGFSRRYVYRMGQLRKSGVVNALTRALERVFEVVPHGLRKKLSQRLFVGVNMLARK